MEYLTKEQIELSDKLSKQYNATFEPVYYKGQGVFLRFNMKGDTYSISQDVQLKDLKDPKDMKELEEAIIKVLAHIDEQRKEYQK